tara:strand:+ start:9822 stop:10163 length:342 start_codon:yes stop_codon:yes gene_type:complete
MWKPTSIYTKYYRKLVFIEYNYKKIGDRPKKIWGVLVKISQPNIDGDYTVVIKNPITKCFDCIASTLITNIIHDKSIENIGNFNSVKDYLHKKLNYDVVNEIPKYLINDIDYL